MDSVIEMIREYSKEVNLEERFNYQFKMDETIIDASTIEKINNVDSLFQKNIKLKELLKRQYQANNDNTKLDFWIINSWGGIYGFKPTEKNLIKISSLKQQLDSNKLSKENFETISSLSKVASFWNPDDYFVYDARVAYALNWLILKYENQGGIKHKYYPMPNSRNKSLVNFDIQTILNISHAEEYSNFTNIYFKPEDAYHAYCNFIKQVAEKVYGGEKAAYLVEMLLFVIADKEILKEVKKVNIVF